MTDATTDAAAPDAVPAAPDSPLAGLRERRKKIADELFVDYAIPRYAPPVYVRFRPIEDAQAQKINKESGKSKDNDINVVANASALAHACIGVFEVIDGQAVSIDPDDRSTDPADWPTFDARLGQLLGLPEATGAVSVVRALYFTDGDILATSGRLAEWSGYSIQAVEEREGN